MCADKLLGVTAFAGTGAAEHKCDVWHFGDGMHPVWSGETVYYGR
jgi:hypothetical protein